MNKKLFSFIFTFVLVFTGLFAGNFTNMANAAVPNIISFTPTSGKVGDIVTINGENFTGVDKILFGSIDIMYETIAVNKITVKVPVGAIDSKITVKTTNGDAISTETFTITSSTPAVATPVKAKSLYTRIVPECNTGPIDSKTGNYINACDFNYLMTLINNVINFILIDLATPLFALIIIYVGWLYLSSGGSSENVTKAKTILKNVIIGYIIALAAWLIVKAILTSLGFTGPMFLS